MAKAPICIHCGQDGVLHRSSAAFYNGKDYGPVWRCEDCDAMVGCHPGTINPLGTCADKETRRMRSKVHAAFDPLWKIKAKYQRDRGARKKAYKWLREITGLSPEWCHISMFDAAMCERVIVICTPILENLRKKLRNNRRSHA